MIDKPSSGTSIRSKAAWYLLAILVAAYVLSYVDRYSLALFTGEISRDLGLTDSHMGLLVGAGFAIVYSLAGVPVAWWLDSHSRRNAVAVGIVIWSLATITSGFSTGFWMLLILRSFVALGEAVLTPGAMSLIGDTFPSHKRALPVAIYSTVSSVMVTGSYVFTAGALVVATSLTTEFDVAAWRLTLMLIGVPGVLIAIMLVLTTREPRRGTYDNTDITLTVASANAISNRQFLDYLRSHSRLFFAFFLYLGMIGTVTMANAVWMPTVLVRRFGYSAEEAGFFFGAMTIPGALLGITLWSILASGILKRDGRVGGLWKLLLGGLILTAPFATTAPVAPNLAICLTAIALAPIGLATGSVITALIVQELAPSPVRARLFALSLLFANIFGMTLGPLVAPLVVSGLGLPDSSIGIGVALSAAVCLSVAIIVLVSFRKEFRLVDNARKDLKW